MSSEDAYERAYVLSVEIDRLRRGLFEEPGHATSEEWESALDKAEVELSRVEKEFATTQAGTASVATDPIEVRGPHTTGLQAHLRLRMTQVPTSIYHLLDADENPLISCEISVSEADFVRSASGYRRVRVSSFIEGYSARAVRTVELEEKKPVEINQLPALFHHRTRELTELSTATVNVLVEDLDNGKVELHWTENIRLLPNTTAPLAVIDPKTDEWKDLSRFFGAYVTPNDPEIMRFLRTVAERHPDRRLTGYQGERTAIEPQVRAVFDALKEIDLTYVNSVVAFAPDINMAAQRVRLPRESLADRQANCIDGTVLMASLLEAMSMNPAIVVIPGHAFLGWETWRDSGEWRYLETTFLGSKTFDQACASGERQAEKYQRLRDGIGDPLKFRRWPLQLLRAKYRITPMG